MVMYDIYDIKNRNYTLKRPKLKLNLLNRKNASKSQRIKNLKNYVQHMKAYLKSTFRYKK